MSSTTELTLGYIPYLNCVPFYHYLKQCGFAGRYASGVPSTLNSMLQRGVLDVSPSSSFEYARNWRNYSLLPNHSIASIGKVKSVLLFSPVAISELSGDKISVTGESSTSVNLLIVLLREFYNLPAATVVVPAAPIETIVADHKPALLIGDRALRLAEKKPVGMQIFDLGQLWHYHTGLPFVFALWMVSRRAIGCFGNELSLIGSQLQQSVTMLQQNAEKVAATLTEPVGLNKNTIIDYWQTIDYRLGAEHLLGLQHFFKLCYAHGLLKEMPQLNFMA